MKNIALIFVALLAGIALQAQTPEDALRYSQNQVVGTARAAGSGGAFGALGADFTSLSINPAGLGLFRKSEFTITPSIYFANTETDYWGNMETDSRNSFNLSNVGFVFKGGGRRPDASWRAVNFGIGLNRIANYNRNTILIGKNTKNSLLDYYAQQAQGTPGNQVRDNYPFGAGLAYFSFLINPNPNATTPNSYIGVTNGFAIEQQEFITERRANDEFVMSLGANYMDKLFIGGTLGIPFVRYRAEKFYSEIDRDDIVQGVAADLGSYDFDRFELTENLQTRGTGINGKLGVIFRPADVLRLGAAVHTPTLMSINERFSSDLYTRFANYDTLLFSPEGEYDYQLTTPWKFVGSAAFLLKQLGFLSIDYEWTDFSQMAFSFDNLPQDRRLASEINREISNRFQSTSTIRVGAEFALDIFRVRAGYGFQSSPYKGFSDFNRQTISAGVGFRDKLLFADVAYVYAFSKNNYYPYTLAAGGVDPALVQNNAGNLLFTLGIRF
ncbi:MAG TPA: hypothetical protein PK239_12615 [Chitinophagales bacterium]|nr:hypothetical protein [Chitinophagales bacterium]